jgi:hypothetical protein
MELEEAAVRVMLHALELSGVLNRGDDFTLEGTILLNRGPDEIDARLEGDDKQLFERLCTRLGLVQDQRAVYRALECVDVTDKHPSDVDALLHRLSQAGDLIFRGFQRGTTFTPGLRATEPSAIESALARFIERFRQFNTRLADMIRYTEMQADSGGCRAAFLVNYLTGLATSRRCGICDLCAPAHEVPWTPVAIVDPEPLEIEPTMAILEAVRDHDSLYGLGTLTKMLLGEAYGKADGQQYQLSAYARNSEHFGALKGVLKHERLQEYLERLITGRQLETLEKARPGDGGTYQAIRLTDLGRDILAGAAPIPGNEEPVPVPEEIPAS